MSFQKNIRKLRDLRKITQRELAEIAGASPKTVSSWEREGKVPPMGTMSVIASYFGINKSALIEDEETLESALADRELLEIAKQNKHLLLSLKDLPEEEKAALAVLANSRKKPSPEAI